MVPTATAEPQDDRAPERGRSLHIGGSWARRRGSLGLLLAVAGVVMAAEPPSPPAEQALRAGEALEAAGKHREAVAAYREAVANGGGCAAQRALARLLHERRLGSMVEVSELFDAVIAAGCAESRDMVNRAELAMLHEGGAKAASLFERAWRTNPGDEKAAKRYGGDLERAGRHADAIGVYQEYLRLRPDAAPFYYFIAGAYGRQKRCEEAERWFRAFLRYAATLPDIAKTARRDDAFQGCKAELEPLWLGVERAEALRKEAAAKRAAGAPLDVTVGLLDRALEAAPDMAILFLEIGEDYEKAGDLKRALYVNEAFLRMAPWSPDADAVRAANLGMRRMLASELR